MQLLKRTTLFCQEGTSDKIYEVDLCRVAPDRYVVNFRYGRRGTTLKEGVKTDQPVDLAKAEKVFEKLVASKTSKGYQEAENNVSSPQLELTVDSQKQTETILNYLTNSNPEQWSLDRIIWRAGELKIKEATPLLINLLGTGTPLRDYSIIWSLGWCGDQTTIPVVDKIYRTTSTPKFVQRIALAALFKLADSTLIKKLKQDLSKKLPNSIRKLIKNKTGEELLTALKTELEESHNRRIDIIENLYLINDPKVRPALLNYLKNCPLKPGYFKAIRHLFKLAEYYQDSDFFGLLSYRIEKEPATYYEGSYSFHIRLPNDAGYVSKHRQEYNSQTGKWEAVTASAFEREMQSEDSRLAYGNKTRTYFQKRTWRTLKKLGQQEDSQYIPMATEVLLAFSDSDAQPPRQITFYRWDWEEQRSKKTTLLWDSYANYLSFCHILYENSPRYTLAENTLAWRCKSPYKPGNPEPSQREEAFPHLWEGQPQYLVRLLQESACLPVHQFAVKVLRDCQSFLDQLEIETIIQFIQSQYVVTAQLGFDLVKIKFQNQADCLPLLVALANSIIPEARATAYQWIEEQKNLVFEQSSVLAALMTSPYTDTRQFTKKLLNKSVLAEDIANSVLGQVFALLISFSLADTERIQEIGEILLLCFAPQLRNLGLEVIQDLLNHPLFAVQELGAKVLLNHAIPVVSLPGGVIDALIHSEYESVRTIGIRLFGQLPDETLLKSDRLILSFILHELPDIRAAIRPVLRRLGTTYPEFGLPLAEILLDNLFTAETHEGLHRDLFQILQTDLTGWKVDATPEMTRRLLNSPSTPSQELAGSILNANLDLWIEHFETGEIIQFSHHEVVALRVAAREMIMRILPRLKQQPQELAIAVRFLESKWEDSQEFGFRFFSTFLSPEDYTPEILVALCDSNNADVRKFGREMLIRCFKEVDGQDYLLKFSEHPSADMQLFATNYLENYASNHPEYLEALQPYFIRVLSQVNKGRIAKQRIFAFLEREALNSPSAAKIVAEILTRQSATVAIGDKAKSLEIMLKLHRQYPDISLPIQVKPVSSKR